MTKSRIKANHSSIWLMVALASVGWGLASKSRADEPPVAASSTTPVLPPMPPAAVPPAAAPAPKSREALLEERLLRMEEMNERLINQVQSLTEKVQSIPAGRPEAAPGGTAAGAGAGEAGSAGGGEKAESGEADGKPEGPNGTIGRGTESGESEKGGGQSPNAEGNSGNATGGRARGGQGTIGRTRESERPRKVNTTFSNGIRWTSEDDEFQLVFHDLTQTELRNFPGVGGQSPLKTSFFIPRQRYYFTGRVTKNVEFYTVLNRGYGSLDLLDAFTNFNYDPRVIFRTGRTKTPTSYEYYQIAEGDLIAPERSLFTGNLSGNRQNGFMFLGQVLDKRAEYALGIFNGPRRSFQDFNNDKDLYAFFNFRPFQLNENLSALKYLNVGGEFDFGNEDNPVQPSSFRTANDQSTATSGATLNTLSPSFLTFNNNVTEYGARDHYSGWLAWYYKSFNLLAQYDGGFQQYTVAGTGGNKVYVPENGFFVQAYYFITGEQITRRVDIKPDRNFAFKNGQLTGPGAIEVHSRISTLDLGQQIFTGGLADRNLWSNHAYAVDTGLNWYLNQYTKIYFDWQHAGFADPIYNGVNSRGQTNLTRSTDLLWLRFQLFF